MRKLLTTLFVLSSLAAPAVVHAAPGVADMTWGVTCTPIVGDITPTAGPTSLMFSVLGSDETHNAYQVRFLLGSAGPGTPDCWRFDAVGCQGSSFITINHLPPATASKTCPPFQGNNASIQIKDFSLVNPGTGYSTEIMRGVMANTYPAGMTAVPATRYFLAQFIFDHTFSVVGATTPGVDCGGFETPICVVMLENALSTSGYVRVSDGVEYPFGDSVNDHVTTLAQTGCPAVPTKSTTWGAIKSQYRN